MAPMADVLFGEEPSGDVQGLVGDTAALSHVDLGDIEVPGHGAANAHAEGEPAPGKDVHGGRGLGQLEGGPEWDDDHGGAQPEGGGVLGDGGEENEGVHGAEGHVVGDPVVVVAPLLGLAGECHGADVFLHRGIEGAELHFGHGKTLSGWGVGGHFNGKAGCMSGDALLQCVGG